MRKVFLIGTNHRYQMVSAFTPVTESQFNEFIVLVRELISRNEIRGIAEEMSVEVLRNWGCNDPSIAYQLAQEQLCP
jgi:hypothetical protein